MEIIVVGGTGTIGSAVVAELGERHDIVTVGSQSGEVQVDLTVRQSMVDMYKRIGSFDALVCCAGKVHFGALAEMTETEYQIGLQHKLMGQVNLVLLGQTKINAGGVFTLTSGLLNHDPIQYGSSAGMVNGALEGFARSAALELPHQQRINVISPTVIAESMPGYAPYFRGYKPVPAAEVALAYSKSVEGLQTGQVFRVGW